MPLSLGLILFLIGLYFLFKNYHNKAKFYFILSFLWIVLISYSPFSNAIMKPLENEYKSYLNINSDLKYVLVLGSGHNSNNEISKVSQLSTTALMRLSEGIRIYKELKDAKLIVSGYNGDDLVAHAFILRDVATSLGIPANDIITQESAKDTQEEASFAKKIIKDNSFVLVTSASHMPRSMKIFKNEGLNPIAAPTNYMAKSQSDYLEEPNARELRKTEAAMHEYIGILWHTIVEKFRFYLN